MTAETMEIKRTVDVIIPVYKPDAVFETLLERLGKQSYPALYYYEYGTVFLEK